METLQILKQSVYLLRQHTVLVKRVLTSGYEVLCGILLKEDRIHMRYYQKTQSVVPCHISFAKAYLCWYTEQDIIQTTSKSLYIIYFLFFTQQIHICLHTLFLYFLSSYCIGGSVGRAFGSIAGGPGFDPL